jgi:MFS family permease
LPYVSAVLGFLWVPAAGHLSDCVGRKRMYVIGRAYVGVFDFIYFALLDTKMPALLALCFMSMHRTVQRQIDKY